MSGGKVKVEGLKELRKALRTMSKDDTYKQDLRGAGLSAAKIAETEARANARRGSVTKSGKHATMGSVAIASIKAGAGQARATLTGGRASLPYFVPWNFGGRAKQFPRAAEPDHAMWKAVSEKQPEIVKVYTDGIERLTGKHFR